MDPSARLLTLRNLIDRSAAAYYIDGTSDISDEEFDQLKHELRTLDPNDARLTRVGYPVPRDGILQTAKHTFLVGSINNSIDFCPQHESYVTGFQNWAKNLPAHCNHFWVQPKLDGLSLVLYYEKGHLVRAVTRGDGTAGEDVTANAVMFKGVPRALPYPATFGVRGEALLTRASWAIVDPNRESNARNLAAGIVRRKDGTDSRHIDFLAFAYHPGPDEIIESVETGARYSEEKDIAEFLHRCGFNPVPGKRIDGHDAVVAYYHQFATVRPHLPYEIDGLVVKVNVTKYQDELGESGGCPKGMVAFKWPGQEVIAELKDVTWSVGHTGKLTPVGTITPTRIGGVEITSVSLHNIEQIEALNIGLNDLIVMTRGGDVIPKVQKLHAKDADSKTISAPVCCPTCGGPVQRRTNVDGEQGTEIFCVTDSCPARVKGKVQRWIKSLDIQGLGDEILSTLTEAKQVNTVADLYKLDPANLGELIVNGKKLGAKRAVSIFNEIQRTRTLTIDQFLGSLGIPMLGKRRVELIRKAAAKASLVPPDTMDHVEGWLSNIVGSDVRFSNLTRFADLLGIPGICTEIQKGIDELEPMIKELMGVITIAAPENKTNATVVGKLSGKSFCVTGTLSKGRSEIHDAIKAAGGEVKDDVNKSLSYLVCGEKAGSKKAKAEKLGVPTITEAQLNEMMG